MIILDFPDYLESFFYRYLFYEQNRILFSHFPIVDTDGYDARYAEQIAGLKWIFDYCECDYNIHGHTHENLMKDSRCINVSIENIRFKPIKLEEIIKSRMKKS